MQNGIKLAKGDFILIQDGDLEYEPEDIMTYVYWHQGQLPPTGPKFEKEWNNANGFCACEFRISSVAEPTLAL